MNRATADDVARELVESGAPEFSAVQVIDDGNSGSAVLVTVGGQPQVVLSADHASALLAHYKPAMFTTEAPAESVTHTYEVGT